MMKRKFARPFRRCAPDVSCFFAVFQMLLCANSDDQDKITEKVYKEFSSKDEEVLEDDIEIREDELTHDN